MMQLAESADWVDSKGLLVALFVMPFPVSTGTGGYLQLHAFQSTGNTVITSTAEDVSSDINDALRTFAQRLSALKETYGLSKPQLASILNVSRPTLDGWLNQSVDSIRKSNHDRMTAIEHLLKDAIPEDTAAYLGAYLRRKLEGDSTRVLSALTASSIEEKAVKVALRPLANTLGGG